MSEIRSTSIFVKVLNRILKEHGKELKQLKSMKGRLYGNKAESPIFGSPKEVDLLIEPLTEDKDRFVAIRPLQLEALAEKLGFSAEEVFRLRAAIIAEAVRAQVKIRLRDYEKGRWEPDSNVTPSDVSDFVAYFLFQFLTNGDISDAREHIQQVLKEVRGFSNFAFVEQEGTLFSSDLDAFHSVDSQRKAIEQALAPAIEAYELGVMWLAVGSDTSDDLMHLGYLAMAQALLHKAYSLAKWPGAVAKGTEQQTTWMEIIRTAYYEIEPKPFSNNTDEDLEEY